MGCEYQSMKALTIIIVFNLLGTSALAQRGHEIQAQFGVSFNKGVSFYDYEESDIRKHTFEFDQRYKSDFYNISWRYPINSYLEAGIYFSHTLSSTLTLHEAESILFDSDAPQVRGPSNLFLGMSIFASKSSEIGIDVRVTMARFNKFKTYVVVNAGIQRISISNKLNNLEVQDQGLREDFLKTYLVDENVHLLGVGFGLSRLLNNGINIRIIEVYGRNLSESKLLLSFPVTFELRTGVSYQFYKRK